jgi:SAM-dependent methyltransferase
VERKYGQEYSELYRRHWWWRVREKCILDSLRDYQTGTMWGEILDVGCGNGLFFDHLLKFGDVEGVEPDAGLVDPQGPHFKRIHVAAFDESFLPGKKYSLILMLDVLEHLSDPVSALCHAGSLLAPDGSVVCTVPAFQFLWTNHDLLNHHFTRYSKRSFRSLSRLAGFEIRYDHYFFQWLFFAKILVRLKEKVFPRTPTVPRIPSTWINKSLFHVTWAEYRLLRRFSVPFGSSLLVIGRKSTQRGSSGRSRE